jgi:predicted esterase
MIGIFRPSLSLLLLVQIVHLSAADGAKVFTSADGALKMTYDERIPAKPAAAKLGLILLFHGNTLSESSLIPSTMSKLEQAGVANQYVVVGMKSIGSGWENPDDAPVTAFIQHALTTYPIDRRRVIGMGYSSGCWYITRYAQAHPEFFAGAIGYVGSQSGGPTKLAPDKVAGLYWVTGHKDGIQSVKEPRAAALRNISLGFPVVYHEEREMAHEFLWGQTGLDAVAWMQPLRAKGVELEADDSGFIDSFADEAKAKKQLGEAKTWMRIVAISGPPVFPVILQGLRSDKSPVQNNAATACTKVPINDEIAAELGRLLEGKDKKIKGPALTALMTQAAWNHQKAQQVLCVQALASGAALADRRAIALSLAQVVKLDLLGAFVYQRVLWTLVDLLDDEDAVLRQSAFVALEPAMTGGFGYQPGANKAGRAAALDQWRGWVEKQCGPRPTP